MVETVFGTGRATTTDSPGLAGEINNPTGAVYDFTEKYVYLSDNNGGGLIRKLAVTDDFTSQFTQQYSVKTVFTGVNCNFCEHFALSMSRNLMYVSTRNAHSVKSLNLSLELSVAYRGQVIVGSLGDQTCSNYARYPPVCYGDRDGVGTYARYNTISSLALLVDRRGQDQYLFLTDTINNKIRKIDLSVGPPGSSFPSTTFDSNVDQLSQQMYGIVANSRTRMLYVSVTGGVYAYSVPAGASSKSILAGNLG
jgi:hypothetical protein